MLDDIHAISCCAMFKNVGDLRLAYQALGKDFTMVAYESGIIRMDIYRKGFKKGTAVKYIYEKLSIDQESTYAFGDGVNDTEMIENIGHGVAMGNACDELKQIAKEHTLSVDEDEIDDYFNKNLV